MAELNTTLLKGSEFFSSTLLADASLKAYYRAEDLTDSSSNGKTLTKTGTVNHSAAKHNNGFDATFTDSTNNLFNATVHTPGTGDITMGCWFKKNGAPTNDFTPTILSCGESGGSKRITIGATKTNGYATLTSYDGAGSDAPTTINICDNVWHFVVITRVGTLHTCYVDGVIGVTGAATARNITGSYLNIGFLGSGSGFDSIGAAIIDDVFVMSRGLNNTEVNSLFGALAYYRMESGALTTDNSGNGRTLTNNNTVGEDTGQFGGAGDFGTANTDKSLSLATDMGILGTSVTLSGWFKCNTAIPDASNWILTALENSTTDVQYAFEYARSGATRQLIFRRYRQGVAADAVSVNTDLGTTWHHMVLTYDATYLRGYLDGALVAGPTKLSGNGTGVTASAFSIGNQRGLASGNGNYSSIDADDVAVFNRPLTITEVVYLYGTYSLSVLNPTANAYIRNTTPTGNAGGGNMYVGELNSVANDIMRSPIKFSLSSIPAGSTINSASLRLYDVNSAFSDNARTVRWYPLLRNWVEGEVTWNNYSTGNAWATAGAGNTTTDREATDIGSVAMPEPEVAGWYEMSALTVSKLQAWLDGTQSNYGGILVSETETNDLHNFDGRSGGNSRPPELIIAYTTAVASGGERSYSFFM